MCSFARSTGGGDIGGGGTAWGGDGVRVTASCCSSFGLAWWMRMGGAWRRKPGLDVAAVGDETAYWTASGSTFSAAEWYVSCLVSLMMGKPGERGVLAKPGVLGADWVRSCARYRSDRARSRTSMLFRRRSLE